MLRGRRRKPRAVETHRDDLRRGAAIWVFPGTAVFGTSRTERINPDDRHSVLTQCPRNRVRYKYLKLLEAIYNRAIRAGRLIYNPVSAVKLYQERSTTPRIGA